MLVKRALALMLLASSPSLAAEFHVRTDGNDACDGTVNVGGSSGACARLTPQAGVNLIAACGDIVTVHAGAYASSISITPRVCSAGTPVVVRGDPAVAVGSVILQGTVTFPVSGVSGPSWHQFRHFTVRPSTLPAIHIVTSGTSALNWSNVTVQDITIDQLPAVTGSFVVGVGSEVVGAVNSNRSILFDSIRISNGGTARRSDAFQAFTSGVTFSNSNVTDISSGIYFGSACYASPGNTITGNVFHDMTCNSVRDSDGCIQGYNNQLWINYNVFHRVSAAAGVAFGEALLVGRRTTPSIDCPTCQALIHFQHNTCISQSPSGGAFDIGVQWRGGNPGTTFEVEDNIFSGYGATDCRAGGISVHDCPDTLFDMNHNLFFAGQGGADIKATVASSGCPSGISCWTTGVYGSGDIYNGIDPFLGINASTISWIPPGGSSACGSGSGGSDIGAKACVGGAVLCGNGSREGPEVCDGADLNAQSCISLGFSGGSLACAGDCSAFDTTACTIATTRSATLTGVGCSGCSIQ
jgi:hypothetical protein